MQLEVGSEIGRLSSVLVLSSSGVNAVGSQAYGLSAATAENRDHSR